MRVVPLLFVTLTLIGSVGCATGAQRPDPDRVPRVFSHPDGSTLTELRGQIHVHTRFSRDSDGLVSRVLDAAARTGTDFVIVTDHDNRRIRHQCGKYRWRGRDIHLMAGVEYSSQRGHLLDLFPQADFFPKLPVADLVRKIDESGGLAIAAHPNDAKRPWKAWHVEHLRGLEVYNTAADIREDKKKLLGRLLRALLGRNDPVLSSIDWPRQNLELWADQAAKGRPFIGVGASNAHGLLVSGRANWDDYENSFALHGNRVWVRSLDPEGIEEAIRAGRLYVAFDALGDSAGFDFRFRRGSDEWLMGESVPAGGLGTISIRLPLDGQIFLYRDRELVQTTRGTELHVAGGAGAWRVEVARRESMFGEWYPWIISNMIRIEGE